MYVYVLIHALSTNFSRHLQKKTVGILYIVTHMCRNPNFISASRGTASSETYPICLKRDYKCGFMIKRVQRA